MAPAPQDRSPLWCRMLAGIEMGVLAGLAMFGWLALSSKWDWGTPWLMPNLLGSALAGRPVFGRGFGWLTVSGLGFHLGIAGLVGLGFALVMGGLRNRLRVLLLGIITGLLLYYACQYVFWQKWGFYGLVYSPPRRLLVGHLVFGIVLGWLPAGLERIQRAWADGAFESVLPPETVETPSGSGPVV